MKRFENLLLMLAIVGAVYLVYFINTLPRPVTSVKTVNEEAHSYVVPVKKLNYRG